MSESESHPRADRFHWFEGASVVSLFEQIHEYGPHLTRVEVHQHGDEMHLRVIGPNGEGDDPINDSRACPPICP